MIRVIVNYGLPEDKATFDAHYEDTHIPLTRAMPNLKGFEVSRGPVASSDDASTVYLTAILTYDTQEDMDAALASPEGKIAVADLANFATGGVTLMTIDSQERL
ncbi:EthD family reductase [Pseudohalocynthiibacter aestuariivivens]|nr:EthD family reductase [Pseudohalocynthiibacter aestuariivivens]QIE45208.1 EthD family reductase [Pseudohalocynthiibacter aestuariivivens]